MTNDTQNLIGAVDIPFHGLDGKDGKSAYEVACDNGFVGTEAEWLESLRIPDSIIASCLKLGYTWYIDTDTVVNRDGEKLGTLKSCMTDDYSGTWFYIRTASSEAGSAAYPSAYEIDGANGYLSLKDYVIWTGVRLVHVSAYEAKASTLVNSDGCYSPASGVDGLMSSTDKAYLSDLIKRYIASNQSGGFNSGNDCAESGLYGSVTAGRPAGSAAGEYYNLIAVKDIATGLTSQIALHEDASANAPNIFFRGKVENGWTRGLNEKDLITGLGVSHEDAAYPNWLREKGIYYIESWASGAGQLPPTASTSDSAGLWIGITAAGAPDAESANAVTQYMIRTDNNAVYVRNNPGYSGAGSLIASGDMTDWETLSAGISIGGTGSNGETWGYIPYVKTDGGIEIGKYIDFHLTSNDGIDRYARVMISSGSDQPVFTFSGSAYGKGAIIKADQVHANQYHGTYYGSLGYPAKLTLNGVEYSYEATGASAESFAEGVNFYAPTDEGAENQVIIADSDGKPVWADSAPLATAFKTGGTTITFAQFYQAFTAALTTLQSAAFRANGDFDSAGDIVVVGNASGVSDSGVKLSDIQSDIEALKSADGNAAFQGETADVSFISDNEWRAGWYWYVADGGTVDTVSWHEGEVILAIKDHPDTAIDADEISTTQFNTYFRIIGKEAYAAIEALKAKDTELESADKELKSEIATKVNYDSEFDSSGDIVVVSDGNTVRDSGWSIDKILNMINGLQDELTEVINLDDSNPIGTISGKCRHVIVTAFYDETQGSLNVPTLTDRTWGYAYFDVDVYMESEGGYISLFGGLDSFNGNNGLGAHHYTLVYDYKNKLYSIQKSEYIPYDGTIYPKYGPEDGLITEG